MSNLFQFLRNLHDNLPISLPLSLSLYIYIYIYSVFFLSFFFLSFLPVCILYFFLRFLLISYLLMFISRFFFLCSLFPYCLCLSFQGIGLSFSPLFVLFLCGLISLSLYIYIHTPELIGQRVRVRATMLRF